MNRALELPEGFTTVGTVEDDGITYLLITDVMKNYMVELNNEDDVLSIDWETLQEVPEARNRIIN